jgi:hypothetical protein
MCLAVLIRIQEIRGSDLQTLSKTPVLACSYCLQATANIVYELCTYISCALYCLCCVFVLFCLCIFILIYCVCTSVRTTGTG